MNGSLNIYQYLQILAKYISLNKGDLWHSWKAGWNKWNGMDSGTDDEQKKQGQQTTTDNNVLKAWTIYEYI